MCIQIFKKSTILSSFAETGLIPYNPEKVLGPLREKLEKRNPVPISTLLPTSSHTTASTWPTPHNIPDMHDYAAQICNTLEYIEASSPYRRRFDRFVTATLGRAIAGIEAEETLCEYKKEAQERAK